MNKVYDFIVIGGGSGGLASARRAAQYGAKVALIEANRLGGTCVNVGCVPKKVMWNAPQMSASLHDAPDYGFQLDVPGFDWGVVKQARDRYLERLNGIYARNLDVAGIDRIAGFATLTGPCTVQVNGTTLEAAHILIATGGAPDVPDVPGAELGITSDGFFDLKERPERVAIVGAGYIAVELAGIFCALGSEVTLILRNENLLRRFDRMLRDSLLEIMTCQNISIVTSTHLQSVVPEEGKLCLLDDSGVCGGTQDGSDQDRLRRHRGHPPDVGRRVSDPAMRLLTSTIYFVRERDLQATRPMP